MRLDNYLVEKGFFDSRTKAKQAIERGEIFIDSKPTLKVAFELNENKVYNIERIFSDDFVSLGGYKLQKAIKDFNLNIENYICADIGASTGGFTDCLIKLGASKVYAVDLNDELLHKKLKRDQRVISIIKNVKNLSRSDFNYEKIDLIVADLSFISAIQALPILSTLLDKGKKLIILIKPQFETGAKIRFKNGIIRDKKIQLEACFKAYDCSVNNSLAPQKFTTAPINSEKNLEFLMLFIKDADIILEKNQIVF